VSSSQGLLSFGDKTVGAMTAGSTFRNALTALRTSNHGTSAAASFFWTEGGGEFPPMALSARGLPDAFNYSAMLTGKLSGPIIERA
jgi:type VI secretion system protein ImpM